MNKTDNFVKFCEEEIELHKKKNLEYNGTEFGDNYTAIRRVSVIKQLYPNTDWSTPEGIACTYMLKQLDAVFSLLERGEDGKIENIKSRLMDVSAYIKIISALYNSDNIENIIKNKCKSK